MPDDEVKCSPEEGIDNVELKSKEVPDDEVKCSPEEGIDNVQSGRWTSAKIENSLLKIIIMYIY